MEKNPLAVQFPTYARSQLNWVGSVAYPPARVQAEIHCHPFHELVFVSSGTYRVEIGDEVISLASGRGIVFRTQQAHRPCPDASGCRLYVLQWTDGLPLQQAITLFHDPQAEIATLCDWLWRRYPGLSPAGILHVNSLMDSVLACMHDQESSTEQGLAMDVAHYLQNAQHEGFVLQELEAFTGRSLRHVNRVFRDRFGISPMRYRRQAMLQRAVHLLCNSNRSIEEISIVSGYRNSQALVRATRSAYQRTPSELRKEGIPFLDTMSENEG